MNLGSILTSFCPKDHSSAMVEDEMESFMQIWQASSVALQRELSLSPWQIFETASGSRHFVGIDVRDGTSRVSPAICQFDSVAVRGLRNSGRVYQLRGPFSHCQDTRNVWKRSCKWNGVPPHVDVSAQVTAERPDGYGVRLFMEPVRFPGWRQVPSSILNRRLHHEMADAFCFVAKEY
jgi:hypothetical protein